MPIRFTIERMARARENHERWWNGTLGRPLLKIVVADDDTVSRRAKAPALSQQNCTDFTLSPEEVVEALDEELSAQEYLGDAFPFVNMESFGPGVLAAFCGANLDNSSGRVWFFPDKIREIADIHVRYDPENRYVQRIKAIYRAGLERWGGLVAMGTPDLGGVMDVAATFRGSENLLMDLYDEPEEVERLVDEIQTAWWDAYLDMTGALQGGAGYTDWSGLLSPKPSYVLQSDFSYMIGNPMFKRFVLPTLTKDAERLENAIYHLDGVGELNHLDDILSIKRLKAVQWVYGDGQPGAAHWLDVYRRILDAGKLAMVVGGPDDFMDVVSALHADVYASLWFPATARDKAQRLLEAR